METELSLKGSSMLLVTGEVGLMYISSDVRPRIEHSFRHDRKPKGTKLGLQLTLSQCLNSEIASRQIHMKATRIS